MSDFMRQMLDAYRADQDQQLEAMGFPGRPGRRTRRPAQPTTPDPTDPAGLARRIAGEAGLPPEMWERLRGSTRAEVEADAEMMIRAGIERVDPYSFEGPSAGGVRGMAAGAPRSLDEVADHAIRESIYGGRSARGGPGEQHQIGGPMRP